MMASAQNDPRRAGTIWAIHLHESRPQSAPKRPVEFLQVGPASTDLLAQAAQGTPAREILRRFEAGSRCYTAWANGQLASYGWVSFHEEYVGELNLRVRLLPGEAYIWDCFTLPDYRRQGLYSALLAHMLSELEKDLACRVWIGADADNVVSQRGIARAGFCLIADMVLARVFAMRLVWVQGRPEVPEPIVAEARRAFLDNRDSVWLKATELLQNTAQPEVPSPDLSSPAASWSEQPSLPDAPSPAPDPARRPVLH